MTPIAPALIERAKSGDKFAAYQIAVELGMTRQDPASWQAAIQSLEQAAGLGHEIAQKELTLLQDWREQPRWSALPEMKPVCRAPVILDMAGFLPQPMCDWLRLKASELVSPALVYDEGTGTGRADKGRTNLAGYFKGDAANMIAALVRRRISQASDVPVVGFEPTQVLSYEAGQIFDWHVDYLDPASNAFAPDLARRGQRIATCLIYLNDDFEGGETAFQIDKLRHRGKTGDALMWSNVMPNGQVDPATIHAGRPPTSGRKWVLSQWVRNRPQPV